MVGITFGCYIPMHTGHTSLIYKALAENDEVIIGVCGFDNDRGKDFIPFRTRYELVKQEFGELDRVKIVLIDDSKLFLDGTFTLENWRVWCIELFDQAGIDPNSECKWYMGEPSYEEKIKQLYPNHKFYVADRNDIPISGTMIRKNPLKYRHLLAPSFFRYCEEKGIIRSMITEDRLHHIISVARKAYKTAKDLGYDEQFAREMFALGWNHDMGYEFDPEHHEVVGAELLNGWKYSEFIENHGTIPLTVTNEWLILNYADMTVSPTGEDTTLDDRLKEIEQRYGKDHKWYKLSEDVVNILKLHFKEA